MALLALIIAPMVLMSLVSMLVKGLIKAPFRIIGGLFNACRTRSLLTHVCAYVCSWTVKQLCRTGGFGRTVLTASVAVMSAVLLVAVSAPYMRHFYGFNPWGFLYPAPQGAEHLLNHYSQYSWWLLGVLVGTGVATRQFWKYRYFHLRSWTEGRPEGDHTCLQTDLRLRFGYLFKAIFWSAVVWCLSCLGYGTGLLPATVPPIWPLVATMFAGLSLHNLNKMTHWSKFISQFRDGGRMTFAPINSQ